LAAAIGPYSPVLRAGPWLITSGQLGLQSDASPPALVGGGVTAQLTQALANGERLLQAEGAALHDVVKATVFLTDMDEYTAVNEAYAAFFGGHRPTRSVVGVVALPLGALVEVELWAYRAS
jgi:2-iminobutanoate/2-iminopropanoate deaminase